MDRFSQILAKRLLAAGLCAGLSAVPSLAQISVRSLKVLGSKDVVEVEVEASDRIVPQTQVLTGPDRLVIDFPNSRPNGDLRSQSVDRGDVKDVRVGLFQSKPPVTRIVIDLKAARSFQVFPYGRTVMIKVVGGTSTAVAQNAPSAQPGSHLVPANFTSNSEPVHIEAIPEPPLQVTYLHGMLSIRSNKATLSEVLYAVQQKTGADIAIPAGAEQEKVVAYVEPAPAPEVLARLLNGSRFNFLILSAPDDPNKLDRVILSTRMDGNFVAPLPPMQNTDDSGEDDEPAVVRNNQQQQPDNPVPAAEAQMPQQTRQPEEGIDPPQPQ
jgi:hypothetical protein